METSGTSIVLGSGGDASSVISARAANKASTKKPVVVGLYGLPGAGKTFLLNQLKQELSSEGFSFHEGSEVIGSIVPGGLDAFKRLKEHEKKSWRQQAIETIRNSIAGTGRVAVVTGHFMFWPESEDFVQAVLTSADWATYTHILYLDVPVKEIKKRCMADTERSRPQASIEHLHQWQQREMAELRCLCLNHSILFMVLSEPSTLVARVSMLLRDFQRHSQEYNLTRAKGRLSEVSPPKSDEYRPVLLLDADRTLAPVDTGDLFWKKAVKSKEWPKHSPGLKDIFESHLEYSYTAFRQATLLYEEANEKRFFDRICRETASEVQMYPEFVSLLQVVAEYNDVDAVIVTCGLSHVWNLVLEREGLSSSVKVVGGGLLADNFVVSPEVKQALASSLRWGGHRRTVWAFGDSPVDLDMMCTAQNAIVVVGHEQLRSRSMEKALENAIDRQDLLRARQAVLPHDAAPRLNTEKLPLVQLTAPTFVDSILSRAGRHANDEVKYATKNPAKLLATPMRDSSVAGPALRRAHHRAGEYLATDLLTNMLGIEEYHIQHVQDRTTMGHRLLHEQETLIIALMRGGEPMAIGVNEVFPLAMLLHAHSPGDIKPHHLDGKINVILVDSVVNTGKSVIEFVQYLRNMHGTIRIVVVAGVLQAEAIQEDGKLAKELRRHHNIKLVALRTSETSFFGYKTTDTGNRLFNSTHLA
ncbi:hypothetical protein MMC10_010704 [Thelotrema lepadinum]|nr:hypothetical protein [Thelotrema lepadinum]